jgi:hypothetical protein
MGNEPASGRGGTRATITWSLPSANLSASSSRSSLVGSGLLGDLPPQIAPRAWSEPDDGSLRGVTTRGLTKLCSMSLDTAGPVTLRTRRPRRGALPGLGARAFHRVTVGGGFDEAKHVLQDPGEQSGDVHLRHAQHGADLLLRKAVGVPQLQDPAIPIGE